MIRLLLVDDQSLIRRGLKALLKLEPGLEVVGEAENGKQALELLETLSVDVILLDIRMPVMDGIATMTEVKKRYPDIKVLALTTFDDGDYVTGMIRSGAAGYLLKDVPPEELVQTINLIYKGYLQIGPGLVNKLTVQSPPPSPELPLGWDSLTPRELEILELIATGASNREIGERLFITEKTVKNHVTNILDRLSLRDRTQAAILYNSIKN